MVSQEIDDLISRIAWLMYGYNFQVTLGIDIFDGTTHIDFEKALTKKYPSTDPAMYPLVLIEKEELMADIKAKLSYRGDSTAGLVLKEKKEIELVALQQQYLDYIDGFINTETKCYYYTDIDGISGYAVWWDYCYVLFLLDARIMFIYGSASD